MTKLVLVPPAPDVDALITTVRGQKVLLDSELALLYGVATKVFNQAVKRNRHRFPDDFAFQLTPEETVALRAAHSSHTAMSSPSPAEKKAGQPMRSQAVTASNWSQIVTSSRKHRGAAYRPWAFTEHGAMMAANILNSPRAAEMSIYVIRAFVKMRAALSGSQELKRRLAEIERALIGHDAALRDLYQKLRPLLAPPPEPKRREIGFHARPDSPSDPKAARK